MKIRFILAWYDLWMGAFWDRSKRRLYILPVPCVGIVLQFNQPSIVEVFKGSTYFPCDRTGDGVVRKAIIRVVRGEMAYVNTTGPHVRYPECLTEIGRRGCGELIDECLIKERKAGA